jgi:hypothetical protein
LIVADLVCRSALLWPYFLPCLPSLPCLLTVVLAQLNSPNKTLYVPVVMGDTMRMVKVDSKADLESFRVNRWNIPGRS